MDNANFQFYGAANFTSGSTTNLWRRSTITQISIPASTDPDDNRTLTNGGTLTGTINPASDPDTYYFSGSSGQKITSLAMNKVGSNSLDSELFLYGPGGTTALTSNDDSGGTTNSLISNYTLAQTGTYRVVAKSYSSASTGAYTISLAIVTPPIDTDDNRTLPNGGTLTGTINPASDTDTYYFSGSSGQIITSLAMNKIGSITLDSYLFLYGPGVTTALTYDDDLGGNNNSLIRNYTLAQTGTYRVVAKSYSSASTGAYTISLSIQSAGGGSSSNLARGKSTSASSQESSSFPPSNVVDGNTSSRWSSAISPSLGQQYWVVDLGSSQSINQIIVRWEAAYAATYWVGYSNSSGSCASVSYTTINRALGSQQVDTINFTAATARCVAVKMLTRAPRMNNYSIYEVEVYRR